MTVQSATDAAMRAAERFGVPVVLLLILMWMIRESASVLHDSVVVPMVRSHTEFLDSTRKTLDEIAHTQKSQADTMRQLSAVQEEIRDYVRSRKQ
jgi:hypothetical protein